MRFRRHIFSIIVLTLLLFMLVWVVQADANKTINITLTDPTIFDSSAEVVTGHSVLGNGAWENSGDNFALTLAPEGLFDRRFMIAEIAEIAFYTLKFAEQDGVNFYMNLYTEPYIDGDADWYGHRLTLEPMHANNFRDTLDNWTEWSTAPGINQLTFYDSNHGPAGFAGAPTLDRMVLGSIDWPMLTPTGRGIIDYSDQYVKLIVIDTGNPWAEDFEGYVDAISLTLTDGEQVVINLDAAVGPPAMPQECEGRGWRRFTDPTFNSEAECLKFVLSGSCD